MKKFFALFIGIMILIAGAAYAENDYQYVQVEDGVHIIGYSGSESVIMLPSELDGQIVTGVAAGAFAGNGTLVELYVPDTYRVIGEDAFSGCPQLRDIYLGSGLESVEARAFADCPALLSVSLVQYDFYEDPTAFEGSPRQPVYNGTDVEYFWENSSGDDYDLLYVAACDMMSRGEFEQARDIFLSLYGYELSSDNYFYCAARVYESRGNIEAAKAIYALMPDLNDCQARLEYYNGTQEVATFFDGPAYDDYYNAFFGNGARYESRANTASDSETESEAIIGGADEPTGIIVGGGIEAAAATETPTSEPVAEVTPEPVVTMEPNEALMAYHIYADDMPFEFEDMSASEGYYAMYYYYDDIATIDAYIALFEENGWHTYSEQMDGWMHVYISAPNDQSYFYFSYAESDQMLIIMYESGMDYGFDPKEGL